MFYLYHVKYLFFWNDFQNNTFVYKYLGNVCLKYDISQFRQSLTFRTSFDRVKSVLVIMYLIYFNYRISSIVIYFCASILRLYTYRNV